MCRVRSSGILVILFFLLSEHGLLGQEAKRVVPWHGTQTFRSMLHLLKQEPIKSIDDLRVQDPAKTTIVIFGDLEVIGRLPNLLLFVNRGGAVLIASDRAENRRLRSFGVTILADRVRQDADVAYRGESRCPVIAPLDKGHPLFAGLVLPVVANRPATLLADDPESVVAVHRRSLPESLWEARELQPGLPIPRANIPSVVVSRRRVGAGKFVIVNGHAVFMNGMLAQRDNSNFLFAYNVCRYLLGDGERRKVLFLEEGQIKSVFNVQLGRKVAPPLDLSKLLEKIAENPWKALEFIADHPREVGDLLAKSEPLADKIVAKSEDLVAKFDDKNALGALVERYGDRDAILQFAIFAMTLLVIVRGMFWLFGNRRRTVRRPVTAEPIIRTRQLAVPVTSELQQAMLQHESIGEAARWIALDWWRRRFPQKRFVEQCPQVEGRRRRHRQRALTQTWQVVRGLSEPMDLRRFQRWLRQLTDLDAALARREIRVAGDEVRH